MSNSDALKRGRTLSRTVREVADEVRSRLERLEKVAADFDRLSDSLDLTSDEPQKSLPIPAELAEEVSHG